MKKYSTMFSVMSGLWILCLLYFDPRLAAILIGPEPFLAKLCLLFFILTLNLLWFYVFFHLIIVVFSYFLRSKGARHIRASSFDPPVALLYATANDFQKEPLYSHLKQDYSNYHVFILDDSTSEDYKNRIDEFSRMNPRQVTVIRRPSREGFKAGNVNYALRMIDKKYEFFSISDADTVLPADYILRLLPYVSGSGIAFAQASQKTNPGQKTPFAQFMGLNTDIHFKHYAAVKNRFGFVMWYGHGALMRRDVYNKVNGLPEVASEDLAYSMKVREAGYEGVFAEDVVCLEDFPVTYQQYRKRNEKWVSGTTECLLKYYPSFLKARHIPWFEKMDVFVSAISLLLAFPFIMLLFLVGIALPAYYTHFQFQGPMFLMPVMYENSPLMIATHIQSNLFWSWDIFILVIAAIFVPLLPAVADYFRQPKKLVKYMASYIFCFFSVQIASTLHFLTALFTRKAVFLVTGDNRQGQAQANRRLVIFTEITMGSVFFIIGNATRNIWFLPVAAALCASPCLFRWNLNSKLMRYVIFMPFVLTLGIIYFIGKRL